MGQNSTEVAYGFGQLGSVFTNLAKPVYPPKDHVIVAIQFLADNTPTVMLTETLDTFGPQFPGTDDTEASAANFGGVYFDACTGARTTVNMTNDTVTITAASTLIKPGQYVLLVNDADTIDAGITVDSETATPIYSGPAAQGVKVLSVNGVNITLDTVLTPASTQTLVFLDEHHGAGGSTMESIVFPKGVTIYGRWTTVTPSATPVICYFGK
tara:strand:- start:160 stop:795 length:636 start_codon:yes stop_codon:yes gene_type:complete